MNQVRIDPLGLLARARGSAETASKPKAEIARMNNTVVGACPICGTSMPTVDAGGIQAYVCLEHCVCLPTKDA